MGCQVCSPHIHLIEIVQGYAKTYQLDLLLAATGEPYDLTGATQIKVIHPGTLGSTLAGPVVEYLNTSVLSTTGNLVVGNAQITGLATVAGITPGLDVAGTGVPAGATVEAVDVANNAVTISAPATAGGTAVALAFTASGTAGVTVVGAPGAGKIQVKIDAADAANLRVNPSPLQAQDLQVAVLNAQSTIDVFVIPAVLNIIAPPYGTL